MALNLDLVKTIESLVDDSLSEVLTDFWKDEIGLSIGLFEFFNSFLGMCVYSTQKIRVMTWHFRVNSSELVKGLLGQDITLVNRSLSLLLREIQDCSAAMTEYMEAVSAHEKFQYSSLLYMHIQRIVLLLDGDNCENRAEVFKKGLIDFLKIPRHNNYKWTEKHTKYSFVVRLDNGDGDLIIDQIDWNQVTGTKIGDEGDIDIRFWHLFVEDPNAKTRLAITKEPYFSYV